MTKKMKDSGVEWIGEIPEDWEIVKLKNVAKIITGNTPSTSNEEYYSNSSGIPWIKPDNLLEFNGVSNTKLRLTISGKVQGRVVPKDTMLICAIGSIGKFGYTNEESAFNQQINAVVFNSKVVNKYGLYYMSIQKGQQNYYSNGNVVKILNTNNQGIIYFTLPNKLEQKSIADFLDKKTLEIDNIISKTKEVIEYYKKYKQSLITETVTKGLDKNVNMKDSGIEWIGDIPEHWEVIRPTRVCEIIRGNCNFQKEDLKDKGDYVALQYGKTYKVDVVDETFEYYVDKSFFKINQVVKKGDTVLISTSETLEDLGHSCFYNRIDNALLGGEQMCLKPNKLNVVGEFLYYVTKYFNIELNQYATGLKVFRFRFDDLKKINVVLPPIDEQNEIIDFLNEKLPLIDNIISAKEKLLTEMESYKKSLIYETVTGKREVE